MELAIRDGRLAPSEPIEGDAILDGGGAWVYPGFVDAHLHMGLGGDGMTQLDLSEVRSREEFEQLITREASRLPAGQWLRAHGWNEERFPGDGLPTNAWLRGAGDRPVVAYRVDYHACVVNEAVLDQVNLDDCPAGGRVDRDAAGAPTGLMVEGAAWHLVNPVVPEATVEQRRDAMRAADRYFASRGLVAVGSMEYARELTEALAPIRHELGVRVLVTLLDRDWPLDCSIADAFENDEMLSVIGFKAFIDGTLGSRSAAMLSPYPDDPEGGDGMLIELAEQGLLGEWIRFVHASGYSPSMHAIGDRALRLALDVADTLPTEARDRVRFEHAQTVHPEDLSRMEGRFASMQPLHRTLDAPVAEARLGPERLGHFYPLKSLEQVGARLAFGSDWPIVDCDPFEGIRAAVTGCGVGTSEVLGIDTALTGYTTEARACLGLDGGTISPGAPADLVLLDRDPRALDWSRDEAPTVLSTIVGGRIVHDLR
ncbi:MAG: amidohydrolase [Planctomycetota bacterium]|nr:amidohydrolase [Planctomycetota bacterium]